MGTALPARLLALLEAHDDYSILTEAALMVATLGNPDLDIPRYLARIAGIAETVQARLPVGAEISAVLSAMNRLLFEELGFGPDNDSYYDPRNSYLDEVIERRRGIPITLSVLYIDIGRKLGLDLTGVSFPGHFLVKCPVDGGLAVIDPFNRGAFLSVEDLQRRLGREGEQGATREAVLERLTTASPRDIVVRMLRNLKAVHLEAKRVAEALPVTDGLVQLAGTEPSERRDRGLVYQELECFRAALEDYEAYLRMAPEAPDTDAIRARALDMRAAVARLN